MASIYLHIPFCKKKCHYCNFFSTVSLRNRDEVIMAIIDEIVNKKDYLKGEIIDSIYFGGGTPSMLNYKELQRIFAVLRSHYTWSLDCEITFELNPDDINTMYLEELKSLGINRLSIGIQSFNNNILEKLNRAHSASEAIAAVTLAKAAGFHNMNVDLIYGIPGLSMDLWKQELEQFVKFDIPHLSAYFITVEPNTALDFLVKKNKYPTPVEDEGLAHFDYLMDFMQLNGYDHYEISNFSKPGQISRHNSNYWRRKPYLGIGPSAHSFNLVSRQWNAAGIKSYLEQMANEENYSNFEELSILDQFNEEVMLSLRTHWGIDLKFIQMCYGDKLSFELLAKCETYFASKKMFIQDEHLILTSEGRKQADGIASSLFLV